MNLNDIVRVKLTAKGLDIIKKYYYDLALPVRSREPDEDGYTTWQLWELFEMFGSHIHLGMDVPFETEILIGGKE